ncbi:MAG: type II toxin-antitoxin system VapC family toxin, partial [Nitrospira sp.]|nr:type II toxin-antitoxin system VapC family toxin [Nitrospira sp.]
IPELLVYELANALRHNPNFTARDVQESMDSIFDMGLNVRKADKAVVTCAIDIAYRFLVTVYDAYFLALSQIEKIPFVTADYKFWGRVKDFRGIIKLSDLNIR